MNSIYPNDVKKIKLNDEIIDEIFTEFKFKYITKKSNSNKILKEIYNTYFEKSIINTKKDESRNIDYLIDEKYFDLFEFTKKHYILNYYDLETFNLKSIRLEKEKNENTNLCFEF